jgi:hypothetical protein
MNTPNENNRPDSASEATRLASAPDPLNKPDPLETELTTSAHPGAAAETGLGEVAQPQDIANVILFLATGLAKHATGTTIDINGASYVR